MWRVPILRAVVIQAPLINFAFTGVLFTITLALRQHGTSTAVIGLVQAAIAAGGLLGAVVAPRLQGRMRLAMLATVNQFGRGAVVRHRGPAHPLAAGRGAGRGIAACSRPPRTQRSFAVMLRSTPEEMRGRASNTVTMVATALAALAPLLAGLLVQHASGAWATGVFASAMAVAAALCLILPGLRDAQSPAAASTP